MGIGLRWPLGASGVQTVTELDLRSGHKRVGFTKPMKTNRAKYTTLPMRFMTEA